MVLCHVPQGKMRGRGVHETMVVVANSEKMILFVFIIVFFMQSNNELLIYDKGIISNDLLCMSCDVQNNSLIGSHAQSVCWDNEL